jgi:hypothetical protein
MGESRPTGEVPGPVEFWRSPLVAWGDVSAIRREFHRDRAPDAPRR